MNCWECGAAVDRLVVDLGGGHELGEPIQWPVEFTQRVEPCGHWRRFGDRKVKFEYVPVDSGGR